MLGAVIVGAAWVGSRLPTRVAHGAAVVGGHLEWAVRPGKRRRLAVNLGHAVGAPPRAREVRRLVRREVVNEARRSADLLWSIGRRDDFLSTVVIEGTEHTDAVVASGRGLILAGIHLGGWEVAVPVPAVVIPVPTSVIVADNWLAWGIQRIRDAAGLHVVYRTDMAVAAARVLQHGEALLVLGDDASGAQPRRHQVRFCDSEALLPAGPVSLARLTGAVLVPFFVVPLGPRRWRVVIEPGIEPPDRHGGDGAEAEVHQQLADRWSAWIQSHPEHWAAPFEVAWVDGDVKGRS